MCSRKWLMVALVVCGLISACSDYNTNLSIQTSSSSLSFVSPSSASVGSQGFTITANGAGFTTGALILWNGKPLTTTLVSSIQLTAPVPASELTSTGTVQVAVQIPGSAQSGSSNVNNTTTTEVSNIVLFSITAAPGTPPSLTTLSPSSQPFCGNTSSFTLTVNGTGFTSDSIVNWNGSPRATTFTSTAANQIQGVILPGDTATTTPAAVTVSNSSGTSNALPFTMSSPSAGLAVPTLGGGAMSPTTALAGAAAQTLTITASSSTSFLACSTLQWAGTGGTTTLPTSYVAATSTTAAQLMATVPASLLATPGTASVRIFTPGPGGGTSQAATFTITAPTTPTISSVMAELAGSNSQVSSAPSCSTSGFTLVVNGTNFVNGGSVVNWNGQPRATTFVSASQVTALIPFTDAINPATVPITVSNGSALSNSVNFSVTAATLAKPAITSLSPSSALAGSSPFTLNVVGTNFVPCSTIEGIGMAGTTAYISPTQLSIPVLASPDLASARTVNVTVSNLASTSNSLPFTISALSVASLSASTTQMNSTPYCSPSDFTLTVTATTGTTFTSDSVVNWNGSPRPTTFISATQLAADISYADIAAQGTVNVTVSNSASTSNALPFTIGPATSFPVPAITQLQPSSLPAGSPGFSLSVVGTGFVPCSTVQWNGGSRTTTFATIFGVTAPISASDIASPTSVAVTVVNPTPTGCTPSSTVTCGGTSNAKTFTAFQPVAGHVSVAAGLTSDATPAGQNLAALPLILQLMSANHRYAIEVLASTDGETEIPGSTQNVFVRDTCAGAPSGCEPSVTLVSAGLNFSAADGDSISPSISADGRYVAFLSSARNLVDSDTNGVADAFVRDTCVGATSACTPSTQRVSVATDGTQADGPSTSATISATGRYVTFKSSATNLGSSPASGSASGSASGLYLRDTCAGADSSCRPSTQALH